jgi:hypothetical protein
MMGSPCAAQVVAGAGLPTFGIAPPVIAPGVDERQFGVNVTGAYDSNVARSDAALAAQRHVIQQDFYALPAGEALFSQVFGRETVYLDLVAGYKAYAKNPLLDRSNIQIGGGAVGQLSLCQGTLAGAYDRAQADISTLPITVQGGQVNFTPKDTQTNAVIDFTAVCGASVGFAPTGHVSEVWVTNNSSQFAAIDAHVFSGSGGITYRSPVLGSATINGQYSKTDYPNRFLPFGGGTESLGFQTTGAGITLARPAGARLSGSLSVNYTHVQPGNGFIQGFSGVTYSANLGYALNPRMNLNVVAGREVTPSNLVQASFELTSIYGGEATYELGSRLTLGAGYSRTHQIYEGILFPVLFNFTEETTNSVYGNADFKLNRRISIGPSVTYSKRNANFAPMSYNDVITSVTVKSTF